MSVLRVVLNFLILGRVLPVCLRGPRTVFIPKKEGSSNAKYFRPITFAPVILRLFHNILWKRLLEGVDLDLQQRAFLPVDGCAENTAIMDTALYEAKTLPLFLACEDLTKAFERVSLEVDPSGSCPSRSLSAVSGVPAESE